MVTIEPKPFYYGKSKIKEIKINKEKNISLIDVYSKIKMDKNKIKEIIKEKRCCFLFENITIGYIDDSTFTLNIGNQIFRCLLKPLPLKIKLSSNKFIEFEIFCFEQFESIIKLFNFKIPIIRYKNNKLGKYYYLHFLNYYDGISNVEESFDYKILNEYELQKIENNKNENFIDWTYNKPFDFDNNFQNYFSYSNLLNEESFTIYKNDERIKFRDNIINCYETMNYYGFSGIGKSITLIGTLKNNFNHFENGTFYINIKCLNKLFKEKQIYFLKQILIDEIKYLFMYQIELYKKVCQKIIDFQLIIKNSFWSIILEILSSINFTLILNCCKIVFDQYKIKLDLDLNLNKIIEKYQENKKIIFIIVR